MQGEFQRTFLMMRPLDPDETGTTGFCRVERSQGRGRLAFNIQGFSRDAGELHAVLAKLNGSSWEVTDCGLIRPDARGNGSVVRDIEGVAVASGPSNKAVGVVRIAKGKAELLLTGFFGRGKPIDREGIERAAARILAKPVPESSNAIPKAVPEKTPAPTVPEEKTAPTISEETTAPATSIPVQAKEADPVEKSAAPSITPPKADLPKAAFPDKGIFFSSEMMPNDSSGSTDPTESPAIPALPENIWSAPPLEPGEFTALGLPEELEGVIWPESVQSLRELFERFDIISPVTGKESEIFIRIPMRDGVSGVDHYLLGVRVERGTVAAVGYAVPGSMDEAPSGLSDYAFYETPVGGYWMRWEEVV